MIDLEMMLKISLKIFYWTILNYSGPNLLYSNFPCHSRNSICKFVNTN